MHTQKWDDDFENFLRPLLTGLRADEPLTADADLAELGLDSMNAVQLLFTLEDHYQVAFPDHLLSKEMFATPTVLWDSLSSIRTTDRTTA